MKKLLLLALLAPLSLNAANWYCRPGTSGGGTSWTDATDISSVFSKAVAGGDTIWVAGGTYNSAFNVTKSGSNGNLIYIKRPRTTDAVPTGAAGWVPAYDSLVNITPSSGAAMTFGSGLGSYLYVDGRVQYGIKMLVQDSGDYNSCISFDTRYGNSAGGQTQCTFTNMELSGPFNNSYVATVHQLGPIDIYSLSGALSYITVSHCFIHDWVNLMGITRNANNITFEYNKYEWGISGSTQAHQNWCIVEFTSNLTIRYNDIRYWLVMGLGIGASVGRIDFYGNVCHDPIPPAYAGAGSPRMFEIGGNWGTTYSGYAVGPIYCYNNVFANCVSPQYYIAVWSQSGSGVGGCTWQSSSQSRNNLYYNWAGGIGGPNPNDTDYDMAVSTSGLSGSHSISSAANPFVSVSGQDYHITSGSAAQNKGATLASPYNFDMDGNQRGADGLFDIGAFEIISGGGYPPVITSQPVSTSALAGTSFTLNLSASGSSTLIYQWYAQTNGVAGNAIGGATSPSYTMSNPQVANSTNYCCVVTNLYGAVTSSAPFVTITNGIAPSIVSQPTATSAAVGTSFTLSLTAAGSSPLAYQWYAQTNGVAGNAIASATTQSYTKSNAQISDTTNYCCVVTNLFGSITSAAPLVTVTNGVAPIPTVDVLNLQFATVSTNSITSLVINLTNTGTGTLNGTASTAAPFSVSAGGSYSLASGAGQSVTVQFTPTTQGVKSGTVTFTGGSGATVPLSGIAYLVFPSNSIPLFSGVVIAPFAVTAGNSVMQTVDNSSTVQGSGEAIAGFYLNAPYNVFLSSTAEGTNDANNSFYVNIDNEPSGQTMVWDITNLTSVGLSSRPVSWRGPTGAFNSPQYSTNVWSLGAGYHWISLRGREANTRAGVMTVNVSSPPLIVTQPASTGVSVGSTAQFTVSASGSPTLTYQWTKGGSSIGGATQSSYTTPAVVSGDNGSVFAVTVGNSFGSVTSVNVTLTVSSAIVVGTLNAANMTTTSLKFGP